MENKTALLIIDMQNDFVLPGTPQCVAGAMTIIPNLKKVLNMFRKKNLPVFHIVREYRADGSDIESVRLDHFLTQNYCIPGTRGCEIIEELVPVKGEYRVVKNRFSGFMNTELDLMLRRLGVTDIAVCGVQYPNCIRATVFDGIALGYHVTVVTDATGAQTEEVARANIHDMANIGVSCINSDAFLAIL